MSSLLNKRAAVALLRCFLPPGAGAASDSSFSNLASSFDAAPAGNIAFAGRSTVAAAT